MQQNSHPLLIVLADPCLINEFPVNTLFEFLIYLNCENTLPYLPTHQHHQDDLSNDDTSQSLYRVAHGFKKTALEIPWAW